MVLLYFRIHGLPNIDSLIFFTVSLLWIFFTSNFVLQGAALSDFLFLLKDWLPHQTDRSFRKEELKISRFSFLTLEFYWVLTSQKQWRQDFFLKLIYIVFWTYVLVCLACLLPRNFNSPLYSLLLDLYLQVPECQTRWRTLRFSV